MNTFGLKTITTLAATVVLIGVLSGCATSTPSKPVTLASIGCQDETLANWTHFSYTIGSWKHGSSEISGFGLFTCKQAASVKFSVTPNGTNLVNAGTFIAFGNSQLAFTGLHSLDRKLVHFDTAMATSSKAIQVPAGQKFQPLAQLDQSKYGLTYGQEPVTLTMTIKVKGNPTVTVKKTLALTTDKSANPKPPKPFSGTTGA